jgi:hypothetical protein
VGVSPFYTRNATEWDTGLLFKNLWTITPKAEFILGIGPQWVYLRQNGKATNSIAGEVAGDFMFWPAHKHHPWVVERSFPRAARFRLLSRDYERLDTTLKGLHLLAFATLMLRNLADTLK